MNNKFSVITFNIKGAPLLSMATYKRIHILANKLSKIKVDVINLQEIFTYYHLFVLKKSLKNFPYCSFGKNIFGPKCGLVTFSKIPIKKKDCIVYPNKKNLKNVFLEKGILVSKLIDPSIFIVNTHLTANRDNDWSIKNSLYPLHLNQIIKLLRVVGHINSTSVICGDLNISDNSDFYLMLMKFGLLDIFKKSNLPTFHIEFMSKGQRGNRIDYILIKTESKLKIFKRSHLFKAKYLSKEINHGYLSDHVGLFATFYLRLPTTQNSF